MDLDIDLSSINVDSHRVITCTIEGIVDEDDLRAMAVGGVVAAAGEAPTTQAIAEVEDPSDLKKLRERHHSVARQIAAGVPQNLVALICGYTESYLSILLNNPAMQGLVEMYRLQHGAATTVIAEKLRTVGGKALDKLDERLDGDKLNNQELLAAAKLGADRSGNGPTSTQHNVNETHTFDHAAILEAARKAKIDSREFIVPVGQVRKALEHKPSEEENNA